MTIPNLASSTDVIAGDLPVEEHQPWHPSPWCTSLGKRIFDVVLATLLLIAALPFMLLAALAVLTSPGPLFFASERVGQGHKRIRVLKFRTMFHRMELGIELTRRGDVRITRAGQFLRDWKVDELPQLFNVVRGDMSLIGPRPDSEEFVNTLPPSFRAALASIRPGITGVASMLFRNEEDLLGRIPRSQLTSYYVNTLLPEKVRLDLEYAHHATMFSDIKLLFETLLAVVR